MKGETEALRPGVCEAPRVLSRPHFRARGAGFTLLEIILVLVLIGLIGAVMAAGIVRVVDADHPAPEDVFWKACLSAEKLAELSERDVVLSFDAPKEALQWSNGLASDQAAFDAAGGRVTVQFLQPREGGSRILIAGQAVETQEIPRVTFYPDGTCTPFRVQFRRGGRAWRITIDPWTCAPMLPPKEAGS